MSRTDNSIAFTKSLHVFRSPPQIRTSSVCRDHPSLQRQSLSASDFVVYRQLIRLALPPIGFVYLSPCICLQILPHGRHPCSWLTVGARQPPFGTYTLEMTPMLGVLLKKVALSIRTTNRLHTLFFSYKLL